MTAITTADHEPEEHHVVENADLIRIAAVGLAAAALWLQVWEPFPRVSVIGLVGTVAGGWPIFAEAWENIRARRMTMELSMTIALVAALAIGQFFTALIITLFVLIAEVLEGLTVGRGRRAIQDLLRFLPSTATVRRNGLVIRIPLTEVKVGEIVLIAPGEAIPVDGKVRKGHSFVDQAPITGESLPAEKTAGAVVYAGTMNQSGALEIAAERIGADTSFGKIVEAVERAERSRAPVQKTADRYAGYLVYFALACAAVTFAITRDARSTISVIIVAGACGIAAGTPLAILGAIGRAARTGAIIKGGRYLEALWSVDVVAFDKTGTVTQGTPVVTAICPARQVGREDVLRAAAVAERRSEHPLGRAIVQAADAAGLPAVEPQTFSYVPGGGIVATLGSTDRIIVGSHAFLVENGIKPQSGDSAETPGATEIFVARDNQFLGSVVVADALRPEATASVQALAATGIQTVLLTGDTVAAGRVIGRRLHIDHVYGDLLPDAKVGILDRLASEGHRVAMVGDGINDAPALTRAAVGVAMGSGTDVARESADIVLLGNDLSKFVETVWIARRARNIIRFNFAGTLAVDIVGVGLAAAGMLNPLVAALIHVTSELAFILNSARLLPGSAPAAARRVEPARVSGTATGTSTAA